MTYDSSQVTPDQLLQAVEKAGFKATGKAICVKRNDGARENETLA